MHFINDDEEKYISGFNNELKEAYLSKIPESVRKLLIDDLHCIPLESKHLPNSNNPFRIRWECEDLGVLFFHQFINEPIEIHVLPTSVKNSQDKSWYNKETLKKIIEKELKNYTNINSLLDRITYYEKPDGSNCCLKIQQLTWKEAESVIPIVVCWSKENQKNKRLPVEIIECLNKLDCTPQYTRKNNDRTIPCKHNKTGKLIIWILRPNIEKDTYGIRTPDITRELEWYKAGDFQKSLPNIHFKQEKKGRWIASGLSKSEILQCLPILVNWMIENKITDKENSDFIFSEEIEEMSKTKELAKLLKNTHNLILHGAPGTGKTYLAKKIAKEMGCSENEIGFVQFHPSYDYTDFVEGLRPQNSDSTSANGFERKNGVFKEFCKQVLFDTEYSKELWNACKEAISKICNLDLKLPNGIIKYLFSYDYISDNEDKIQFSIIMDTNVLPPNSKVTVRLLLLIRSLIDQNINFEDEIPEADVTENPYVSNYYERLREYLLEIDSIKSIINKNVDLQNWNNINKEKVFVFIIDEINRGELSKIFGELFFSIDPSYRGTVGLVQTQYQNLVPEGDVFKNGFYIPENVYIIGTMNDIDRSVESMDLAMRRRFAFKEVTAADSAEQMLTKDNPTISDLDDDIIDEMKSRMKNLNDAIISEEIGLSPAYQIGAAYFLKYSMYKDETEPFDCLWEYNLEPLLHEYLRGQGNVEEKMEILKTSYDNK